MNCILTVKVIPCSGIQSITRNKAGMILVHLKKTAERGAANHELISFFSKTLKIPSIRITILSGGTRRIKNIRIEGKSKEDVITLFGIDEVQRAMV